MKGRKSLPTEIKQLKGTAKGADKKRVDPITFAAALLEPPEALSDSAKDEWRRVAPDLYGMRVLSKPDRAALAAYCDAYAIWHDAKAAIKKFALDDPEYHGLMIKTKGGNIIQNPLLGIANTAAAAMVKYGAEFGMTPSARARIHVAAPNENPPGEAKKGSGKVSSAPKSSAAESKDKYFN